MCCLEIKIETTVGTCLYFNIHDCGRIVFINPTIKEEIHSNNAYQAHIAWLIL